MDWTPGVEVRDQYAYGYDKADNRWPDFVAEYLQTVAAIEGLKAVKNLRGPLRWFAAGVRAQIAEDQFQYFWFVIEQISEITKEAIPVSDKCQRCRGDLFCPTCNATPTHRPFAKQAIENLFSRLDVSTELQRDLFKIRNGLMHGRDRLEIVEDIRTETPGFDFGEAIDLSWEIAMAAIFNALQMTLPEYEQMSFGKPDSIVRRDAVFKAHMRMGMNGDPKKPQLQNVVVPQIKAFAVNERGEEIDPRTGDRVAK
jgi:Methylamine utilization protein MauJ